MLFHKNFQKFLASVALLATVISFSGFTSSSKNNQTTQTELVLNNRISNYSNTKTCFFLYGNDKKVTFNHYTFFSFKSLLNTFNFNFYIRFKSQKKNVLQFIDLNNPLKQNLIAKTLSAEATPFLIK